MTKTQREMAIEERDAITALTKEERKALSDAWELRHSRESAFRGYQYHIAKKLNRRATDVTRRRRLLSLDAPELWELLESGKLTLSRAFRCVDDTTSQHNRTGEPLEVCLRVAIAKNSISRKERYRNRKKPRFGTQRFWADTRARVLEQVVRAMGTSIDPAILDAAMARMNGIVLAAIEECRREVNSLARGGRALHPGVSQEQLRSALGVLGIDMKGTRGHRIDMSIINKKKRLLVRQFHPDLSPGNRERFEAVIDAVRVIERWNEGVETMRKGKRNQSVPITDEEGEQE